MVCIHISSDMSGTIQSALIAKEHVGYDDIHIVDSRTVTLALGQIVVEAARAVQDNKSLDEVLKVANDHVDSSVMYAIIDTLKYLKKGGRIKASSAVVGSALNIKPVITINMVW